jgi:RNA-binding protein NOB1
VHRFAQLTGDAKTLSATDVQIIALTYQLEKQYNGTHFLKTEPVRSERGTEQRGDAFGEGGSIRLNVFHLFCFSALVSLQKRGRAMDAVSAAAAHGTAAAATAASRAAIAANAAAAASQTEVDNSAAAPSAAATEPVSAASETTAATEPEVVEVPQHEEHESDDEEDVKEAAEAAAAAAAAAAASTGAAAGSSAAAPSVDSNGAVFTVPFESKEATTAAAGAAAAEGDDNDGEGSWITPSNLHQHRGPARAPTGPFEAESAIACVTTDYAMQNVLLQLGARLLSLRGRSIRSLRSWMKKCHACDALSADLSREFCDRCGHHSMIRVQVTVNRAGLVRFWHGTRHLNLRGTIYSIPRPKGGRHANNLLLSEDMVDERIKKGGGGGGWAKPGKGQDKTPNQMFQDSIEFGIGRTGPGGGQNQFGYGKRNPNAHSGHAQKKKGKK